MKDTVSSTFLGILFFFGKSFKKIETKFMIEETPDIHLISRTLLLTQLRRALFASALEMN